MDELAINADGLFTFCTFYMKMLSVAMIADAIRGAIALFADETGDLTVLYKVIQRSVYRGFGNALAFCAHSLYYLLGGNASAGAFYIFEYLLSLACLVS